MQPTYWTNPPPPFLPGSRHAPVPGWGANPAVAGPARVGVGAYGQTAAAAEKPVMIKARPSMLQRLVVASEEGGVSPEEEIQKKIPWWYFVTGAMVLGASAALAINMGWIKRR